MNPLIERLGWMLIHSAWEDLLLWGALQVVLATLGRRSAHLRYLTACAALLAMALVPWLTFDLADFGARMDANIPAQTTGLVAAHAFAPSPEVAAVATLKSDENAGRAEDSPRHLALGLLVAAWVTGLLFFTARLAWQWSRLRGLIRTPWRPLPTPWPERLAELARRAGIRGMVMLGETAAARVPVVAPWLKPVILLPLGIAASLPAEQVEMILLHELAHIARHDFAINLLQRVIETVFFYHPAVWSVSRRIRRERELACDDRAVAWSQNPRAYAEALAACEDFRHEEPLLAATGGGDLLGRIERVLGVAARERRGPALAAAAGILGVGVYLASMLLAPVLAAHVMSASERVAKIQAMQPAWPGEEKPLSRNAMVQISGTIRTEDRAQPKVEGPGISQEGTFSSRGENWSQMGGFLYAFKPHEVLDCQIQSGRIGMAIWVQGYAPFRLDNIQAKNGAIRLDLVLRRGFPGRVRIIDPTGKPIPGVALKAVSQDSDSQISVSGPEVETNAAGEATFGQVEANSEIHLTPSKPEWAMQQFVVSKWSATAAAVLKLQPAAATMGVVQDATTHRPVAHASVVLAAVQTTDHFSNQTFGSENGPVLAHADEQGWFELTTLNHEDSYRIYIVAPGYQTLSYPVLDGEQGKVFSLSPGLHVRGHILDPKLSLKQVYAPQLRCDYSLEASPNSIYGVSRILPLAKVTSDIPFEFDDLSPGRIEFLIEKRWHRIDLQKNVDDLVINLADGTGELAENLPDPATRKLIVRLQPPAGSPAATGRLDLEYQCVLRGQSQLLQETPEVTNGVATMNLPPSSRVTLRGSRLNGYWFPPEVFPFPAGSGDAARDVKIQPAGVIHGAVTADGDLATRPYSVSPMQVDAPPAGSNPLDLSTNGSVEHPLEGQYVTSSLPLGHTYVAVLASLPTIFVSEPARIDAEHPIAERKMHLVANDSLTGRILDHRHQPVPFADITMTYYPKASFGFSALVGVTRRDGTFTISHMNFAVPGFYEIGTGGRTRTDFHIDGHTPQPVEIVMAGDDSLGVPALPVVPSAQDSTSPKTFLPMRRWSR